MKKFSAILFFCFISVGAMNPEKDIFWSSVNQYAKDPKTLLTELGNSKDHYSQGFVKCFSNQDQRKVTEAFKNLSVDEQKEIAKVAEYLAETLVEDTKNKSWEESIPGLEWAKRFSCIVRECSAGVFQNKDSLNRARDIYELITMELENRKDFVEKARLLQDMINNIDKK